MKSATDIVIVGEAEAFPWKTGRSATRLRRWFEVNTYEELAAQASLLNVCPQKYAYYRDEMCLDKIDECTATAKVVFLVGKIAQRAVLSRRGLCVKDMPTDPMWLQGMYAGLPHPSGKNHVLNDIQDSLVSCFVKSVLRERGVAE